RAVLTLGKALEPEFREYGAQVMRNAKALAQGLLDAGGELITGGTDNHMMVLDTVKSFGLDGRVAEESLDEISITTNKQIIPDDPNPPLRPSGIRIGTPAATARGMKETEMARLAGWIVAGLKQREDAAAVAKLRAEVEQFCRGFPVPGLE
ncbi:MAG: serine hydroxymethyltransferase, partial [Myxococcales bacterium]|nr:serine hydroxymethyltransferase [Myxococcales bacterium]